MKNKQEIPFDDCNYFLTGSIDGESIEKVIRWIMMGARIPSHEQPTMKLYINSDGGNLIDTFALIDVMRTSPIPITTIGMGHLMSSAFLLFAAGTKGQRAIAKNTSIMIHQFSHEYIGKYHDMRSYTQELDRINDRMVTELSRTSGMSESEVSSKLLGSSDVWLTAEQLVGLGIADYIF